MWWLKFPLCIKELVMVLSHSTYTIIRNSLKLQLEDIKWDEVYMTMMYQDDLIDKKRYHNRMSSLRKRREKVVKAIINVKALQKFYD
jgi:hypothetical protein